MNIEISLRPPRRKNIAPWEQIFTPTGAMRVCKHQARLPIAGGYWRVFWENTEVEYIADIDEVDLLWLGKSPAQLGLDRAEEKPASDDYDGCRLDLDASAADAAHQLEREMVP